MIDINERPPDLNDQELAEISKEELVVKWKQMQLYVTGLESTYRQNRFELAQLRNVLLTTTQSFTNELDSSVQNQSSQSSNTSTSTTPNKIPVKHTFVDPLVNSLIIQLKKELDETRRKRDELQIELNSTKFTPESQINKRLMAKCRKVLEENSQLGQMISSGNVAQLEHELAYHKELLNEVGENERNMQSFLIELDSSMDLVHRTISNLDSLRDNTTKTSSAVELGPDNNKKDELS